MKLFFHLSALIMGSSISAATAEETAPLLSQQQAAQQLSQLNIPPDRYINTLFRAAKENDTKTLSLLLAAGVMADTTNRDGTTPLQEAALRGNTECVNMLLAAGADVNHRDDCDGRTALVRAIQSGHADSAAVLAEADGLDFQPWTPLTLGVARRDMEDIHRFIGTGNDVNEICNEGFTPLQIAATLGNTDAMKVLLEAGADIELADDFGYTPLCHALLTGKAACVQLLLKNGATVHGSTALVPLHIAIEGRSAECLRALLQAGADANQSNDSDTPLHQAVFFNRKELITILLEAGADPTRKNSQGQTPADIAKQEGYTDILEILD